MLPGTFSSQIGNKPAISITLSSNVTNYNLFTAAGSPTVPTDVYLTINSGVYVLSGNQTTPAMTIPTFPAGTNIRITNNGKIYGHGGDGGDGGAGGSVFGDNFNGDPGIIGSDAISISCNVSIDNTNGQIFGGGNGGHGGKSLARQVGWNGYTYYPGGGGGGGQGTGTSAGGLCADTSGDFHGNNGKTGNTSGPGDGGSGAGYNAGGFGSSGLRFAASGDPGGGWGVGGSHAVKVNGHAVTWLGGYNTTQVKGLVS